MAWNRQAVFGNLTLGVFWRDPEPFWLNAEIFYEAGNFIAGFSFWRFQTQLTWWK